MTSLPWDRKVAIALLMLAFGLVGVRAGAGSGSVLDVAIRADGSVRVDGAEATVSDWRARLRDASGHFYVRLRIEDGTPFARLAPIWEQAHFEGISHVDMGLDLGKAIKGPAVDASLSKSGELRYADEALSPTALLAIVQKDETKADSNARVNLRVDAHATWSSLRAVLEPLVAAGVRDVSLAGRTLTVANYGSVPSHLATAPDSDLDAPHAAERAMTAALAVLEKDHARLIAIRNAYAKEYGLKADFSEALAAADREAREAIGKTVEEPTLVDLYRRLTAIERDMGTAYRELLAMQALRVDGGRDGLTPTKAYEQAIVPRRHWPTYRWSELHVSPVDARAVVAQVEDAQAMSAMLVRAAAAVVTGPAERAGEITEADLRMHGYRGPELMPDELDLGTTAAEKIDAVPGRHVSLEKPTADWLYPDVWYIVGPFPGDRRRTALDRQFGPETDVGLNLQYESGREPLAWQWQQAGATGRTSWKIEPARVEPYGVYYAFTEIHSDRAQTVWIAAGVDDYGKLWVNDELIWRSPSAPKPYNAMENIQSLDLKQGVNKVLVRFENAGGTTGFSLLFRLKP